MHQSKTGQRSRRQWYGQAIPSVLLAVLYGLVVVAQTGKFAEEVGSIGSGTNWAYHILAALHAASVASFFGILAIIMFTRRQPIQRERRPLGWLLPIAVTVSMSAIGTFEPQSVPVAVLLAATVFVVLGTTLTLHALRFLGRNFGVVSDVRGLVTHGPYARVRHPLYAGEAVTSIGMVLAVLSPATIALFAVSMSLQVIRAKVEEQALTRVFPEYAEYAKRTPMLIPYGNSFRKSMRETEMATNR